MKRELPFVLVFIFGLFCVIQFFVPHESFEWGYEFLLDWIYIIGIFALALLQTSIDRIGGRSVGRGWHRRSGCSRPLRGKLRWAL